MDDVVQLSVITATRNLVSGKRMPMIRRLIDSVAKLTVPYEHIIMDGDSTDGTQLFLQEEASKDGHIRFVSEPDTGIYNALNKGIGRSRGKWILVLGSDDYICDVRALERTIDQANRRNLDLVCSPVKTDSSGDLLSLNVALYNLPCCHQGLLAKREFIIRMGGFDENYRIASDYAFSLKAFLSAPRYAVMGESYSYYCMDGLSSDWGGKIAEITSIAAKLLGLREDERESFAAFYALPFRILLPLLFHSNALIRRSASWSLLRRCIPHCLIKLRRSLKCRRVDQGS